MAIRALPYLEEPSPERIERLWAFARSNDVTYRVNIAAIATLLDFGVLTPYEPPAIALECDPEYDSNILDSPTTYSVWAAGEMMDPQYARSIAVPVLLDKSEPARRWAINTLIRFKREYAGIFIDILNDRTESDWLRTHALYALKNLGFTYTNARLFRPATLYFRLRPVTERHPLEPRLIHNCAER